MSHDRELLRDPGAGHLLSCASPSCLDCLTEQGKEEGLQTWVTEPRPKACVQRLSHFPSSKVHPGTSPARPGPLALPLGVGLCLGSGWDRGCGFLIGGQGGKGCFLLTSCRLPLGLRRKGLWLLSPEQESALHFSGEMALVLLR